jgi:hypothetical protein
MPIDMQVAVTNSDSIWWSAAMYVLSALLLLESHLQL